MEFETFRRTPQSQQAKRDEINDQIETYLAEGRAIQEIPNGVCKHNLKSQSFRIKPITIEEAKAKDKKRSEKQQKAESTAARAATLTTEAPTFITQQVIRSN